METTQTVQENKKMMACKTCGAQMAKSAKKCPSCGAKNARSKWMGKLKKLIIFVVVIAIGLTVTIINSNKKGEIGKTIKFGDSTEIVVNNIEVYENEWDLLAGGYTFSGDHGYDGFVKIDFSVTNVGKNDVSVSPDAFHVDYDDGVQYKSDYLFLQRGEGDNIRYSAYPNGILLKPVTSETENLTLIINIPKEVALDKETSLDVYGYNHNFTIR